MAATEREKRMMMTTLEKEEDLTSCAKHNSLTLGHETSELAPNKKRRDRQTDLTSISSSHG